MTFAEIERVLGFKLPNSKMYPAWWSNNPTNNVMTRQWLAAGFKTEQVDVNRGRVVFRRTRRNGAQRKAMSEQQQFAGNDEGHSRRHPLFGWMKGTFTIAPSTDLTEPADPDWANIADGPAPAEKGSRGRI